MRSVVRMMMLTFFFALLVPVAFLRHLLNPSRPACWRRPR